MMSKYVQKNKKNKKKSRNNFFLRLILQLQMALISGTMSNNDTSVPYYSTGK